MKVTVTVEKYTRIVGKLGPHENEIETQETKEIQAEASPQEVTQILQAVMPQVHTFEVVDPHVLKNWR